MGSRLQCARQRPDHAISKREGWIEFNLNSPASVLTPLPRRAALPTPQHASSSALALGAQPHSEPWLQSLRFGRGVGPRVSCATRRCRPLTYISHAPPRLCRAHPVRFRTRPVPTLPVQGAPRATPASPRPDGIASGRRLFPTHALLPFRLLPVLARRLE
jgi:hypothetical protein